MNTVRFVTIPILVALSSAAPLASQPKGTFDPSSATATYRVRFEATWSSSSHPNGFPAGGHFSPLVGATHDSSVRFWRKGQLANQGIEQMAEIGNPFPLIDIVEDEIAAGRAEQFLLGGGISSPGTTSITFTATREFPRLTLVSMLAPSPDWFVGVSARRLVQGGDWVDYAEYPLRVYDAGSDSGQTFNAANSESSADIRRLVNGYFPKGSPPVGRFVVQRIG
jgi:Spondin_N